MKIEALSFTMLSRQVLLISSKNRLAQEYEFANKHNYVNPFVNQASLKVNNTPENSLEREDNSHHIKNGYRSERFADNQIKNSVVPNQ